MKTVPVMVVASLLVLATMAQVGIQVLPADPDHPGQCYDPKTKEAHPVGSTWYKPGECLAHSCRNDGGEFQVTFTGCGLTGPPPPPCKLVTDDTKQHPDCCPKVTC